MLIHRIKLKNILSFGPDGMELELKPLNVLIGPNGSGKSNLIEAMGSSRPPPRDMTAPIIAGGGVGQLDLEGRTNDALFCRARVCRGRSGSWVSTYSGWSQGTSPRSCLHGRQGSSLRID